MLQVQYSVAYRSSYEAKESMRQLICDQGTHTRKYIDTRPPSSACDLNSLVPLVDYEMHSTGTHTGEPRPTPKIMIILWFGRWKRRRMKVKAHGHGLNVLQALKRC